MAIKDAPYVDPEMLRSASKLPAALANIFFRCVAKLSCGSSYTPRYLAVSEGSSIVGGSLGTVTDIMLCPYGSSGIS
jgi:hypothetical protein